MIRLLGLSEPQNPGGKVAKATGGQIVELRRAPGTERAGQGAQQYPLERRVGSDVTVVDSGRAELFRVRGEGIARWPSLVLLRCAARRLKNLFARGPRQVSLAMALDSDAPAN